MDRVNTKELNDRTASDQGVWSAGGSSSVKKEIATRLEFFASETEYFTLMQIELTTAVVSRNVSPGCCQALTPNQQQQLHA